MMEDMNAVVAAHRFGLGEPDLRVIGAQPREWLVKQIGPADPQQGSGLVSGLESLSSKYEMVKLGLKGGAGAKGKASKPADGAPAERGNQAERDAAKAAQRDIVVSDLHSRLATAVVTRRPFAERLALFWSNHFTVSQVNPKARGLAGAYEREAIRPNIAGSFETLLRAAILHPGMLRYLDNQKSVGPHAEAVMGGSKPKIKAAGLNENLARELLELHTLGAESSRPRAGGAVVYGQRDVQELARVLTGWTTPQTLGATEAVVFNASRHEPGSKVVLGRTYAQGPEALGRVLSDLAREPATAHFLATKLVRHFIADEPPTDLVDQMAAAYLRADAQLPALYRTMIDSPLAWQPGPAKLKTPEEFAVSAARVLRLDDGWLGRGKDGGIEAMGQRLQWAPSPAGWSDRAEDWLGPDAVWKRIEWANRLADRHGGRVDARALAREAFGPALSETTATQIARAADGAQALTLLLMSPEFQRR
jgi:uncharacterized protein (DUF1800 family)